MKNIAVSLLLMALPAFTFGAEVGIAGAIGTTTEIRLPIKTAKYLIEPYISHYLINVTEEADAKVSENGVGIAIWRLSELSENTFLQYGAQLGYLQEKRNSGYLSTNSSDVEYGSISSTNLDGFLIAPGFGLFYAFNSQFEAGLEVKYRYRKSSGDRKTRSSGYPEYTWQQEPNLEYSETTAHLQTQVVVRVFF